ncbi:CDP-glycerol glycerophosphotransferase family protein [Bacillus sp. SD075]|uniref:CDP-glycerol glycerophosphotransferase family protein n=1 Tax=Bacillus sp. SD075 TaxID=2781732 RepID=UPI001A958239|nr:CDP-glycerol glycerophosphotransferase family protein [Bacillus sp. SD075]MBO1000258.1 CDP-glycerol glycerophosphotransferase family protein [Bacillus sp. SD075]
MYGEIEVNDYHLLKYNLLYDFFHYFSSIKIYGLPLAQCLAAQFDVHIKPFIDKNRMNPDIISGLRKQNRFQTMGDIGRILLTFEKISPVTIPKNKNSILLSEDYYDFAVDQLKEYKVTLFGVQDKVQNNILPKQFEKYLFRNELSKLNNQVINQKQVLIKAKVEHLLKAIPQHYYFSTSFFQHWLLKVCITSVKWVYILEQLILKSKPAVIIIPSEASIFGAILGLLSKKYKIPLINMPVFLIGDRTIIPSRADYYLLWGENQKQWFIKRKVKVDKLTEIGNLRFYYEMKGPVSSKEMFYQKFNIPYHHQILGFTSQPFQSTNVQLEKWIEAIPKNFPVTILIKKHSGDKHEYPLLSKNKNVKILSSDYPLYDFLHYINCLMTISSNTAIEAALLDKPLLILQPSIPYHYNFNNNQHHAHLAKAQAGEIIKSPEDLINVLTRVTTEPSYMDVLKKKGNKFLTETLKAVEQAPMLAKKKIQEIILKHS